MLRIGVWLLLVSLLVFGIYLGIREREPEPASILGRWELRGIVENGVQIQAAVAYDAPGQIPWLFIRTGKFTGFDGCNELGGTAVFTEQGRFLPSEYYSTASACGIGGQPMGTDRIFSERLRQAHTFVLQACELRLYYNYGSANYLLFERQPCIPG
ncbi:MAG: META domain-containing protein [Anaerolineales bacterium]|nr:META domain-containing protein [Anaerolineales bacterium]